MTKMTLKVVVPPDCPPVARQAKFIVVELLSIPAGLAGTSGTGHERAIVKTSGDIVIGEAL